MNKNKNHKRISLKVQASSLPKDKQTSFSFLVKQDGEDFFYRLEVGGERAEDTHSWKPGALSLERVACEVYGFKAAENFIVARVAENEDGSSSLVDTAYILEKDMQLRFFSVKEKEGLAVYRHTSAHVMAYALSSIYPEVKLAIGPVIEDGFYYDIDELQLKQENFEAIEEKMAEIIRLGYVNERVELSRKEALELFQEQPYKVEIIRDLPENETISVYKMGDFIDLCRGPHLPNIKSIKAFKLLRLAGAYWRGSEKNKMLTRIYATSFEHEKELRLYIKHREEAALRDHNRVGREMGLFVSDEYVGKGLPLFTPQGNILLQTLKSFVEKEERKRGYMHTLTPYLAKSSLYKISGHWQHYKESMFVISGDDELALRPMTCPFHFTLYNSKRHSYRDLPVRYAETSVLFRNEDSGEMHGLTRVRQFTLADGHVICTPEQVQAEFESCLELLMHILSVLEIKDYTFRLSRWDKKDSGKKYIDNPVMWERTEALIEAILRDNKITYYEGIGEAAFYGPKLDIQTKNTYGKEDTLLTVQIDFALPERFKMFYMNNNNEKKEPVVIHRSSIGCYERTLALLLENCKGKLPFWLIPSQIAVLSVQESVHDYVKEIVQNLLQADLRVKANIENEALSKKIKLAQKEKTFYMVIVGEKELATKTLSVRMRSGKTISGLSLKDFREICRNLEESKENLCLLSEKRVNTDIKVNFIE